MASVSGLHKIVLKGGYSEGGTECEEGPIKAAAYPGMNMVRTADAAVMGRDSWTPGSSNNVGTGTNSIPAGGSVMVLKEDALQGKDVDDVYTIGDNGYIHIAKPGDHLQVLVASGQTVIKGDGLSAAATGKWSVDAATATVEALEGSGGALGEDTLVRVAVL
jgi:hypothetical protein